MRNSYPVRKKKIRGPDVTGAMKTVRVDANTLIMVPVGIPNQEAIDRFNARIRDKQFAPSRFVKPIDEVPLEVLPIGSTEELCALV
jgi:hypothetical protein